MFDQPAADHRPNSRGNPRETGPRPGRASPFILGKRAANDCETARNEQGGAEPLRCTCDNQLMNIGSDAAPRRRHSEQSDTNQEDPAASIVIAKRSAD